MDRDFVRHKTVGGQLRRRQMPPLDMLVTGGGTAAPLSPLKSSKAGVVGGETFDAQSYIAHLATTTGMNPDATQQQQQQQHDLPPGTMLADGSMVPMRTMSEFRKQVISSKKMGSPLPLTSAPKPSVARSSSSGDTRYELTHNPG